MEIYYSQHGEDFLLNKIFEGKSNGYYVEIGCLDGIEFSNTYFFEKRGWQGVCIEAHRDFIAPLKKNRPKASVVHCAVGEEDRENVTFYANRIGSLSTLNKNEEERWRKHYQEYFHGFEEQKVAMKTLTTIFNDLSVNSIDFISLDIEGYEVQALAGLDFNRYRPRIFIVEYKDEAHKNELEAILFKQGYHFLSKLGCNLFYSLDSADKSVMTASYGVVPLLQIDFEGNERWHKADHLRPDLRRKIRNAIKRSWLGSLWRRVEQKKQKILLERKIPSYKKKRAILEEYRQAYRLRTFVETGTFLGDTVDFFKDRFDQLYSIELSEELFTEASNRFANIANVTMLQGDSGVQLGNLIRKIDRPALFWLDGHYSHEFFMGDRYIKTARGEKVTPIINELTVLLGHSHQHVILIDDARLFNGQHDYPRMDQIKEMVRSARQKYHLSVDTDIIRIVPASSESLNL